MKKKSILIVGVGNFGRHIAEEFNHLGHDVMAIDQNEDRINSVMPYVTNAQIGDSTNELFMKTLGIESFDVCFVTIGGDFQSSLESTCLLKELKAKKVVSRAERDGQAKFLLRNGADDVIYPEKQLASWIGIRYSADHILDYIQVDDRHAIFEVSVPKAWIGKTIAQLDVRRKYSINVLATKKDGKISVSIMPDTVLTESHTLLVWGEYKALQKCFKI